MLDPNPPRLSARTPGSLPHVQDARILAASALVVPHRLHFPNIANRGVKNRYRCNVGWRASETRFRLAKLGEPTLTTQNTRHLGAASPARSSICAAPSRAQSVTEKYSSTNDPLRTAGIAARNAGTIAAGPCAASIHCPPAKLSRSRRGQSPLRRERRHQKEVILRHQQAAVLAFLMIAKAAAPASESRDRRDQVRLAGQSRGLASFSTSPWTIASVLRSSAALLNQMFIVSQPNSSARRHLAGNTRASGRVRRGQKHKAAVGEHGGSSEPALRSTLSLTSTVRLVHRPHVPAMPANVRPPATHFDSGVCPTPLSVNV